MENSGKIRINIRGRIFETTFMTINSMPGTKLSKLSTEDPSYDIQNNEFFFDRDPDLFNSILNLHILGKLHVPRNICAALLQEELKFWECPMNKVAECCWKYYFQDEHNIAIIKDLDVYESDKHCKNVSGTFKENIKLILNNPFSSKLAMAWFIFYCCVILLSTAIYCAWNIGDIRTNLYLSIYNPEGFPDQHLSNDKITLLITTDPPPSLFILETVCLFIFMGELVTSFFVCRKKKYFLCSFTNVISLILVFSMLMNFIMEFFKAALAENEFARWIYFIFKAISMVRLLLFVRIARIFSALRVLLLAIRNSLLELFLMVMTVCIGMLIFSALIFYAEINNTKSFPDIFVSMWWAVITMTTVGYGDVHPLSIPGYFVGALCALFGLLMISLPIGVIVLNFSNYYRNNSFRQSFLRLQEQPTERTTDY